MAADLEEQKKAILPFMQRAQEIQQADPKVAYYCRLYAVEQGMQLPSRSKEVNSLLVATVNQLEKDKARLELDPAGDRIHCLGFALRIFDNADRVDRAGKATERTSKAFYAASVFIEILNHFYEGGVDAELFEKQRYCAWRAAEIRKAVREGRQPTPPPASTSVMPGSDSGGAGGGGPGGGGVGGGGPGGSSGGAGALDDLPAASGSSDWAYRSSAAPPPPPAASSDHAVPDLSPVSRGDGSFSFGANTLPLTPPASASASSSYSSNSAPPSGSAWGAGGGGGSGGGGGGGGARFWPGTRLLVRTDAREGLAVEGGQAGEEQQAQQGTVGQVVLRPDGGHSYKVALRDRLLEVADEAAVPALSEGDPVALYCQRRRSSSGSAGGGLGLGPATSASVLLINDASWPPTYLVKTQDGQELAASAQQLGPAPPAAVAAAAALWAPLPPAPPVMDLHGPSLGPIGGGGNGTAQARGTAGPHAPAPSAPHPPPAAPWQPPPPPPPYHPPAAPPSAPYPSMSGPGSFSGPPSAPPPPHHPPPPPPAASRAPAAAPAWPAPAPPPAAPPAAAAAPTYTLPPGYKPPLQVLTDAQKQAKYAVSALSFEDVHTAVKHLNEALRLLTAPGAAAARR